VAAAPPAARAQSAHIEQELAEGLRLYQDLEYRGAIRALRSVRVDPDATRGQKLRALELIGISYLILGEKAEAEEAFQDLLTIDSGYALQHDEDSPKIREFYDRVKPGFAAGMEARLEHSAPRGAVAGRAVEIEAVVLVGMERVKEMVLRWRRRGVLDYASVPMTRRPRAERPTWRGRFVPPASRTGYDVDYYLEARSGAGGAIGRVGGPETPLSLPIGPGEGEVVVVAPPPLPPPSRSPWYARWYVVAGGAAVVGVAAAALVLSQRGGPGDVADGTLDPGRITLSP
jgi:hypothetical protein